MENLNPLTTQTTQLSSEKVAPIEELMPKELVEQYNANLKALKVTEAAMMEVAKTTQEYRNLGEVLGVSFFREGQRGFVKFRYRVVVDGYYVKKEDNPIISHIDPKTMNLLLNSKILTDEEKRKLLDDRGLLPSVTKT